MPTPALPPDALLDNAAPAVLYAQALSERTRSPHRLRAFAARLRQSAGGAPAWEARCLLLESWATTYEGRLAQAREPVQRALGALLVEGDIAGAADARDLLARVETGARRYEEAGQLLHANLALAESARSTVAWCNTFNRLAILMESSGRFDEALRWHYRSVALAPEAGHPAELALALSGAGGLQLSLNNADDGATLLAAAWEIVHPAMQDWCALWPMAATNHVMALRLTGHAAQAAQLAATVEQALPRLQPINLAQHLLLLASAYIDAGQCAQGQRLVDAAVARLAPAAPRPTAWVWAQARLWAAEGRPADVLRVCDAHLAEDLANRAPADFPKDLQELHTLRARAHEALGNMPASLLAERAAMQAERELFRSASRAQRLTLQIRYDLDAARRERDEAQRRAAQAQQERQRLAEHNAALEETSRARSRFLAAASHDLRQPVHALGLQLALLEPQLADGPLRVQAERMQQSLDALKAMFDALLDISRIDAGVVVPRPAAVRLRPLCARLAEEFTPAAQARGLRLALRLAGPAVAHTDAALLETVLRNLLDNAVKYTLRGGVVLALRRAGPDAWRIQVRDTGPGIAAEEHELAFEEFRQLPRAVPAGATTTGQAGTGLGLGLSIVRRLAQLLGHPLNLQSRAGRGCLFELQLASAGVPPAGDAAAAAPPGGMPMPAAPRSDISPRRPLRLALLEDHEGVRSSLAALLRHWGHEVFEGADAAQVRARLAAAGAAAPTHFDGVLADLRLAGGLDGLEQARALDTGAPVLVITAESAPAALQRLAAAGVPWLAKPLDAQRLAASLEGLQSRQILEAV
ncbi:MAG: hybrid sensor histidine kinase/response regulator [Rubrivivax sp.]|nr:hybrid sensor histidine kinase/response regulator [Rubrivivax sp.]